MSEYRIDEGVASKFVDFYPDRSRGVWIEIEDDGSVLVVFSARVGGGNRPNHQDTWRDAYRHEWNTECNDDGFDPTYAYFTFKVPEDRHEELWQVATTAPGGISERTTNDHE